MNIKRIKTIVMKDIVDGIRDGRILVAMVLPFAFALFFDARWAGGDGGGQTALALSEHQQYTALMLIPISFLIIMIAIFVVPIMLAEESEKKTLEVLVLISSYREVVMAKAGVGIVYVSVSLALMLRLTGIVPENPALFGLAIALLSVTLIVFGLLLGGIFRNTNQLNTWSGAFLFPLFYPAIHVPGAMSGMPELPAWAEAAVDASPVSHGLQLMINGALGEAVFDDQVRSVLIIAAWAVGGYLVLLWNLRRRHRAA